VIATAPPGLIGIQRAAFDRAEATHQWAGRLQWLLALLAVVAILAPTPVMAYAVAALALGTTAGVIWLEHKGRTARSLGSACGAPR